jgi:hypothetical protein
MFRKAVEGHRRKESGQGEYRRSRKAIEGKERKGETIEGHGIPWKEGEILWEHHGRLWNLMESHRTLKNIGEGRPWKVVEPQGRNQTRTNRRRKREVEGDGRSQTRTNRRRGKEIE